MKIGDRVTKNPETWVSNDFDSWGRGSGIGVIVEPPFELNDNEVDVRWPNGRCFEYKDQLILLKRKQMTTEELLEKYEELTEVHNKERALWNLLKANEDNIKGLIEKDPTGRLFHKAFRQADICDSGYMDMAIWHLLSEASLFWEMLEVNDNSEEE